MAKIIFRPVCSVCGKVLYCDVNVTESQLEAPINNKEPYMPQSIDPTCCSYCGETFETIVMPTRLPYRVNISR